MTHYKITMQHTEESLTALSHMQYDLFCTGNRIARSLLSFICIIAGLAYTERWWGILLIAYGCYLTTSTYSSSNHTARKLVSQLRESHCDFPCSTYLFDDNQMRIISQPDKEELSPLPYSKILRMGEDFEYFYLFRDQYGGYMIPKKELDSRVNDFRKFLMQKTNQTFRNRRFPLQALIAKFTLTRHQS